MGRSGRRGLGSAAGRLGGANPGRVAWRMGGRGGGMAFSGVLGLGFVVSLQKSLETWGSKAAMGKWRNEDVRGAEPEA